MYAVLSVLSRRTQRVGARSVQDKLLALQQGEAAKEKINTDQQAERGPEQRMPDANQEMRHWIAAGEWVVRRLRGTGKFEDDV